MDRKKYFEGMHNNLEQNRNADVVLGMYQKF